MSKVHFTGALAGFAMAQEDNGAGNVDVIYKTNSEGTTIYGFPSDAVVKGGKRTSMSVSAINRLRNI